LDLTDCRLLSDTSVKAIAKACLQLGTLSVAGCAITDEGACAFPADCRLKEANFSRTNLHDAGLISLARCANLTELDISISSGYISLDGGKVALGVSPALEKLVFTANETWRITKAGLFTIEMNGRTLPICPLKLNYEYRHQIFELSVQFSEDIKFIRTRLLELKTAPSAERAKDLPEIKDLITLLHEVKHLLTPHELYLLEHQFPAQIAELDKP